MDDAHLVTLCERTDRDQWADCCAAAPPGLTETGDVRVARIAGAVAGCAPGIDVLAMNRVVGLGMFEPATGAAVDACIEFYRHADVPRFFVQLCPIARPTELPGWLAARGLHHHNNWMRLYRTTADAPPADSAVRVVEIGRADSRTAAAIVGAAFGFPPSLVAWVAALVGRPGWRHYLGYDGDRPIATAAMFTGGEAAWFGLAGTAPDARGRGAQRALIARRVADAAAAGCRHLVVETAEDTPEKPNPSTRNLQRCGFTVTYLRPNYIWTRESIS